MNWRGRPLTSHDVIVNSISATTTRTGLTVRPAWTTAPTPPGPRSATRRWALPVTRHPFHGDWNYTLHPAAAAQPTPAAAPASAGRGIPRRHQARAGPGLAMPSRPSPACPAPPSTP